MNLRIRYICGILVLIFVDIYLLLIMKIPSIKHDKKILFGVGILLFFLGIFLEKKWGYMIDKYKKFFIIVGLVVGIITVVILVYV